MLYHIILLIISLVILSAGAEVLVRGSVGIARHLGVSSFFIGLTIVGFGTSTPELATGIVAAWQGHVDINVGNVVGSNICNIALILGLTSIISPIPINTRVVRSEVWIVIVISFVPLIAILNQGLIMRWEAAIMLAGLALYIWRGYRIGRKEGITEAQLESELQREFGATKTDQRGRLWINIAFTVGGIVALSIASKFLVDSSVFIAREVGISELVIGLTVIAFGTSAPELITSLVAAVRKQQDISVGNILGSNIFNILCILSVSSLVSPQTVNRQVLWLDTPFMIILAFACLPIMLTGRHISRLEGAILLTSYVVYVLVVLFVAPQWFPPIHS